jgi:dTDP-4-amino-4,6-dideoxygalactose transaminase
MRSAQVTFTNKKGNTVKQRIFLSPPHMSGRELGLVQMAFASNYIAPLGPMVDAFEKEFSEYVGIPHCVALSSGTAAMHLALRHLGVGPGDVVLASSLTFIGSVSPATFLGAELRFIDCDKTSWNMDPGLLKQAVGDCLKEGRKPAAVIPTDLYGQCADYDAILSVCKPHSIPVLIDSAEAMGAKYRGKHSGFGGTAAVYSFNGNKIITTSGGGMLASEDKAMIDHARKLSTQARENFPHYEHVEIGFNYRMSNVIAAIGRGQLEVLDQRVARRREIFEFYKKTLSTLPGISFMPEADYGKANRWLTVTQIDRGQAETDREKIRLGLEAENIESRPIWKPMHLQPVFAACRMYGGLVSESLFQHGLCLPSGTAMTERDLERVCKGIKKHFCTGG